jgi:hypothetical protein
MQRFGPYWLERVHFDLSFDQALQPRYALAMTQPLLASLYHDSAIDLEGRIVYETAGASAGDVALHYRGRWYHQEVALGVGGGIEDRRREEFQRYRLGAELSLRSLEVHANLYDDIPAHPASREIAERRLDAYDLEIGARVPFVPWAWVWVNRLWEVAVNGQAADTYDRVSLRLTPLAPLEIETGAEAQAEDRSWFAQLRWRMQLGD